MPFDMNIEDNTSDVWALPDNLNFPVHYEPSKLRDHKYVINGDTGEYIGHTGNGFNCQDHPDYFPAVQGELQKGLTEQQLEGVSVSYRSALNNAWAMMDVKLPNMKATIETAKHSTEIARRIIALNGVNGCKSKTVIFGAIDFFCTNGMVTGDASSIKRKNTSGSSLDLFINELATAEQEFYRTTETLQHWARTPMVHVDVKAMLDKIIGSEQMSKKMYSLYSEESAVRGANVFALYSAFTNYASYQDERNGFKLRNTGKDTEAKNMWDRESRDVMKWINTPVFKELVAA
jgi:hypothetical protein|tara:strand:- start:944 stop:1813 length:870 start_codon:yes stop_codon:yes gene_type:complete